MLVRLSDMPSLCISLSLLCFHFGCFDSGLFPLVIHLFGLSTTPSLCLCLSSSVSFVVLAAGVNGSDLLTN